MSNLPGREAEAEASRPGGPVRRWTFLLAEPDDTRPYDLAIILVGVVAVAFTLWLLFG